VLWPAAVITAVAVTVAFFAMLYERPVPWLSLLYFLAVPIPFLAAGLFLFLNNHRAGRYLLSGTILGPGLAAPLEWLVKARWARHGPESWMPWALATEAVVAMFALACFAILIGLFPTCVPVTPGQRWFVRAVWWLPVPMLLAIAAHKDLLVERIAYGTLPPLPNPLYVPALAVLAPGTAQMREVLTGSIVIALGVLLVRYRHESRRRRRQIRWVLSAAGATIAIGLMPFLIQPLLGAAAPAHGDLAITLSTLAIPLIPLSCLVALEPPAWLDADAVIRKSFIYGALSLGILAVYALIAALLGLTAGAGLPVEVAIAVTAVLAFSFQPVRDRLRAVADRWVFGDLGRAPAGLAGGSEGDGDALPTSEEVGERLARIVRSAIRLQWVSVSMPPAVDCAAGTAAGRPALTIPLMIDGARLGEIRCGPKLTGRITERDARLIAALGHQSALLIANRQLTGRLVQVQEAERRRIERNLHDGAQQDLVTLVAELGMARSHARRGALDEQTLAELQQRVQAILRDVRELAQGIHPTVLTDGGLVEAVEDRCNRLPISIRVTSSPGLRSTRFDDDIEGAGYFLVAECLTNALKHSRAAHAQVDLSVDGGRLTLMVADDGIGFDRRTTPLRGLTGLADRFTALAGSLTVTSVPGGGTVVLARLPVETGGRS